MSNLRWLALALCLASGCGGDVNGAGGAGGASTGAGGASTGAGGASAGGGGGSSAALCPVAEPSMGAPCSGDLECSYGDDPRAECRTLYRCQNGAFQSLATGTICSPAGQNGCPSSTPTSGASCEGASVAGPCGYGDATVCVCAGCIGGPACAPTTPKTWHCGGAPADPACPATLPNSGASCSGAAMCTYGLPCGGSGQAVQCKSGAWSWVEVPCPV